MKYDAEDYTHFAHIHDFLREAGKDADIFLIIEKVKGRVDINSLIGLLGVKDLYIGSGFIKKSLGFFRARLTGYKNFYVHYSFGSAFLASIMTKLFGGKVSYWNCGLPWNYKRGFLRDLFERSVYKMVDYLVTGTESMADAYARHYNLNRKKIKIMPNWISLERFTDIPEEDILGLKKELGIKGGEKIILFVHRLSNRKGAHFLPQIFRGIKAGELKMIIIGDGPEREALEKELSAEIKEKKVLFLGWIPNKDLLKYYVLADLFIMPSEEEGFPRVLIEAMAVGLPFVAFDIGGVKEIVPPSFLNSVSSAGDIKQFIAIANRSLLLGSDETKEWKKTAKEWVKRFDTGKVVKIFLEMF